MKKENREKVKITEIGEQNQVLKILKIYKNKNEFIIQEETKHKYTTEESLKAALSFYKDIIDKYDIFVNEDTLELVMNYFYRDAN